MSLTENSEVFVAIEESALNDLITAVCTTRPHLLNYGSSAFVPASSTSLEQQRSQRTDLDGLKTT